MNVEWVAWLSLTLNILIPVSVFAGRHWLRERIVSAVQFRFDSRLEELRAELRKREEELKSNLRAKESEIAALRDGVLSGRMQRQAVLDKRRIEAVEHTWSSVVALTPYKGVSGAMAVINLPQVDKRIAREPKLQQFFGMMTANIPDLDINAPQNAAYHDRPFLSPLAWAYFSAYSMIAMSGFAHAKMLGLGLEGTERLMDVDSMRNLLRTTLPYRTEYIERLSILQFHALLDDLERELLGELGRMLDGIDADQASIDRAAAITSAIHDISTAAEKRKANAAGAG